MYNIFFQTELQSFETPREDYSDIINCGFVDIVSDDTMIGHKIIVISACNLPNNNVIDRQKLQRLIIIFFLFLNKLYEICPRNNLNVVLFQTWYSYIYYMIY